MANILKDQYSSIFSQSITPPVDPNDIFKIENNEDNFSDFHFSPTDIIQAIDDLSENAAAGPDGYPAILLKRCKQELAEPLYNIWRQYLD